LGSHASFLTFISGYEIVFASLDKTEKPLNEKTHFISIEEATPPMRQASSPMQELARLFHDVPSTSKRIREWNQWLKDEKDDVKRFIFRWISFNGLYNAYQDHECQRGRYKRGSEKEQERKIIENFCNDFVRDDLAGEITKSEAISNFKENIHDESRRMDEWLNTLKKKSLSEDERAKAAVMVAYQIRCRLFHGEKSLVLDVNKEVCEAADLVISKVLEKVLL
jgi:hypothetical protein